MVGSATTRKVTRCLHLAVCWQTVLAKVVAVEEAVVATIFGGDKCWLRLTAQGGYLAGTERAPTEDTELFFLLCC